VAVVIFAGACKKQTNEVRDVKLLIFTIAALFSFQAIADSQCGISKSIGLMMVCRINGAKPESQKVTFLKNEGDYNNIKMNGAWLPISLADG
jgi:hypothetical protein